MFDFSELSEGRAGCDRGPGSDDDAVKRAANNKLIEIIKIKIVYTNQN